MRRTIQLRIWFAIAAILLATIPALGQQSKSPWRLKKSPIRGVEVSARSEISAPQGAGYATFKIWYQPGVNPPVIIDLIIESYKRLPVFPFEKYAGPVEMTGEEFVRFEVAGDDLGGSRVLKVMPNGGYRDDTFFFDTIDKSAVSFLLGVRDGQKLSVMVNGLPSSIRVAFDTTGLKQLLDHVGLKAVPQRDYFRQNKPPAMDRSVR